MEERNSLCIYLFCECGKPSSVRFELTLDNSVLLLNVRKCPKCCENVKSEAIKLLEKAITIKD